MRLELVFDSEKEIKLPFHYNLCLQKLAYSLITDDEIRNNLHNQAANFEKRIFKPLTFSNLIGNFRIQIKLENSFFYFTPPVKMYISTNLIEITKEFVNSMLNSKSYSLDYQKIDLISLRIMSEPDFSIVSRFRTLSPITLYSTFNNDDGTKFSRYYEPRDPEFSRILKANLIKKGKAMYGIDLSEKEFYFKPINFNPRQMKKIRYKNIGIQAWSGDFELHCDSEFKRIGYEVGFGSKNAQGFGCVDAVEE